MHKRAFLFIFLFVFLAFFNTLSGDFIADDGFLIVGNDFYKSFTHLKFLFSKQYFLNSDAALSQGFENLMSSGSVAYRPVLSLTYFTDYYFWKLLPLGYHLTNLLLHIFSTCLVYLCFWHLFKRREDAFVGSLIFSLHPLVSEAVSVIGFRADLVATALSLLSFLFYIRRRNLISVFFLFFAVFAKESALVLPGLFFMYDLVYGRKDQIDVRRYIGPALVCLFYLWIYFFVFPNAAMHEARLMGGNIHRHILSAGYIFSYYVFSFFNPFLVRVLPPASAPRIDTLLFLDWTLVGLCCSGMIVWTVYALYKREKSAFFLSWFFIALFPVSNVIPLLNPYANRFMYLPMIGLCGLLTLCLQKLGERTAYVRWVRILRISFISACLLLIVPTNVSYQSDPLLALSLVRDNPEDPMGYLFVALNYMDIPDVEKAKLNIEKGMERGLIDPRAYYILGWYDRDDLDKQLQIFSKCQNFFPYYSPAFTALGRAFLLRGDLEQAENFLVRSLALNKTYHSYLYLMQVKRMQGKEKEVTEILEEALSVLNNKNLAGALHHFEKDQNKDELPIDIGF